MARAELELPGLIYRLCQGRKIPVLVTDSIAKHLVKSDAIVIGHLSRELNRQVNRIFYPNVVLDLSNFQTSGRKAVLLFRSLLTNPNVGKQIERLCLTGSPLAGWKEENGDAWSNNEEQLRRKTPANLTSHLSAFDKDERQLFKNIEDSLPVSMRSIDGGMTLQGLCLAIMGLSVGVVDLQIDSDYFRYADFRGHFRKMVEAGALQHLKKATLCRDLDFEPCSNHHILAVHDWDDAMLAPFLVPSIEEIEICMALQPSVLNNLHTSNVTRLDVRHMQTLMQEFDLVPLLAGTPRLRYLAYHVYIDEYLLRNADENWNLGHDNLFDALPHVSGTLEELVATQFLGDDSIYWEPGWGCGHEPPYRQRDEMSKLPRLHTLSISYVSFLGWKAKQGPHWASILPPALTSITLYDDLSENFLTHRKHKSDWTDRSLMPVLEDLLNVLANRGSKNHPSKFSLVLKQAWDDFNEPERRTLHQKCEERGIVCRIEKTEENVYPDG